MAPRETKTRAAPGTLRRVGVPAGVLGLVLALIGCGSGGQSKESAEAALLAIPGISEASVDTRSSYNGFQKETSTSIEVTLENEFSVPDPDGLVDYLLRVAWSSKTKEANSAVEVIVLSEPQISIADALEAGQWANIGSNPKSPEDAVVQAREVKDRFGDWPGEVPEQPGGSSP